MLPDISVVIPLRNESPNVPQLYRELTDTLEAFGRPYEILLIDDGSTDDTFEQLAALQSQAKSETSTVRLADPCWDGSALSRRSPRRGGRSPSFTASRAASAAN